MRLLSRLLLVLLAIPVAAQAAPYTFTGSLRIAFGTATAGGVLIDQTVNGSGTADITLSGGDVDAISGLSAGSFVFAGPTVPISDPALLPVSSSRVDASNLAGNFAALTSGGGGTMGLDGQFTIGLFGDTSFIDLALWD